MAQKWEYLNKKYVADSEWATLGEQGWELAGLKNDGAFGTCGYIFKRPKDEKFPEITPQQRQQWTNERANSNDNFSESEMEDICRAFNR